MIQEDRYAVGWWATHQTWAVYDRLCSAWCAASLNRAWVERVVEHYNRTNPYTGDPSNLYPMPSVEMEPALVVPGD